MRLADCLRLYEREGLKYVPLRFKSKVPAVKWKAWLENFDYGEARRFLLAGRFNLALACGSPSDNLAVLDADEPELAGKLWGLLKGYPIWAVKSSRGVHFYFKLVEPALTLKFKGFDVKAEGSLCTAPPSVHPTGARYEFLQVGELARWGFEEANELVGKALGERPFRPLSVKGVKASYREPTWGLELDGLEDGELIALLAAVSKRMGCAGLARLYEGWLKAGVVPLRQAPYPNGRGLHFNFEVVTLGILKTLGLSARRAASFSRLFRYPDGPRDTEPGTSALVTVYRYDTRCLIYRGLCPFCREPCVDTPLIKLWKLGRAIKSGYVRPEELAEEARRVLADLRVEA